MSQKMLADTKEYVLCEPIYMKFKSSLRLSTVRSAGRDVRETSRVLEMFCI